MINFIYHYLFLFSNLHYDLIDILCSNFIYDFTNACVEI